MDAMGFLELIFCKLGFPVIKHIHFHASSAGKEAEFFCDMSCSEEDERDRQGEG